MNTVRTQAVMANPMYVPICTKQPEKNQGYTNSRNSISFVAEILINK